MKKHLILALCLVAIIAILKVAPQTIFPLSTHYIQQDSLADYNGKYKLSRDTSLYVVIKIEKGALVATQSWDNTTKDLGHLNGDNFIVIGMGRSVQFVRGDDKKVNKLIVSAEDVWNKSNY